MESPWTYALIGLALVALYFSAGVPRAWRWIAVGGASFFISTLFLDYGPAPHWHPFVTFACDAAVCLIIVLTYLNHGGQDWEIGVFIAFLCSMLVSLLRIGGAVPIDWVYASLLELANVGALLWITWTGVIETVGRHENSPVHSLRAGLLRSRGLL
jgi:hypothetical protein